MDAILEPLTAAQREAVTHIEGPLLVLAGPGSGKTRVVTHRIAYLLHQGVYPSQIVALTFTNKAADEMARRVAALVPGRRVWISTFHSFCARLLREFAPLVGLEPNFSIYDADASLETVKQAIAASQLQGKYVTADRIAHRISWAKARLLTPEQLTQQATDPFSQVAAQVYPVYQQLLLTANAVDFDDLLVHVARLLHDNPELRAALDARYRFVLVDEYQDTNLAQYAILRGLSVDYPNVAVTGDPDQSIYSWRGADITNILRFEDDYPNAKVVRLEQNFRSTQRIVEVAGHLIQYNRRRKHKDLYTENPPGAPVRLARYTSSSDEANDIAQQIADMIGSGYRPGDFAIFYRTNALSRSFEQALRRAGVPYQVVRGLEFYQRREIKDLLAYLYLLNNPRDDAAFRRVVNVPPRGIGRQTLQKLADFALQHHLPLLEAAQHELFLRCVSKRIAERLWDFTAQYQAWRPLAARPVADILNQVIADIDYLDYVDTLGDDADVDRQANVAELVADATEFDASHPDGPWLESFLERVALVSDTDNWDTQASKVSLMTLHAAKGLEFPVVFIVGVEDGFLPHDRSRSDPDAVEEERRLLFVGITRARQRLQLSFADVRTGYHISGAVRRVPSSFLQELPLHALEQSGVGRMASYQYPATQETWETEEGAVGEEPSWQIDSPVETDHAMPIDSSELPARSVPAMPVLQTASALLRKQQPDSQPTSDAPATTTANPQALDVGDVVMHPDYGLGKVVRATGRGKRRVVAVQFLNQPQQCVSFCLAFCPLTLVARKTPS